MSAVARGSSWPEMMYWVDVGMMQSENRIAPVTASTQTHTRQQVEEIYFRLQTVFEPAELSLELAGS